MLDPKDYECCKCVPNDRRDANTMYLVNFECPIHGPCWHRRIEEPEAEQSDQANAHHC